MADYFEEMGWRPLENGENPNHFLHFARLLRDFGMFEELGEDKKLPPPASKEYIKNLKRETVHESGKFFYQLLFFLYVYYLYMCNI